LTPKKPANSPTSETNSKCCAFADSLNKKTENKNIKI
jgi:hypothetical protein